MKALDGIGRVDNAADRLGVLKIGGELFPVMLPGVDYQRVFFLPLCYQFQQGVFTLKFVNGCINRLQILDEFFLVFGGHVLEGVTDLMDHAALHLSLRKSTPNGFGKAFQVVNASNENVLQVSVFEISEHLEPEAGPFTF
jgi:hypothetical protein